MGHSISVVICAYDEARWDHLRRAVRSVQQQHSPPAELIVVVDHNPDLLALASDRLPRVKVVDNTDVQGLSGARNSGVRASSGEVIAFMDDDAVAAPDWLGWLEGGYASDAVAGVGGAILPAWEGARPAWFPEEFDWVVGCTYRGMPARAGYVRNLIGANMSFTREALVAGGAFRSGIGRVGTLPVGCEETELCIRIGRILPEARFLYEPRALVRHHVPASRSAAGYFLRRCFNEGRSKALVTAYVGARGGLSTESHYATRTLPAGMARALGDAVVRRRPSATLRGPVIATGLLVTTAGYVSGKLQQRRTRDRKPLETAPETPWITNPVVSDQRSLHR